MIYHFLPEAEHFSEFRGGAISRWAANMLRDEPDTHIVCSSADESWGFAPERIHLAPQLRRYLRFRARRLYPPQISGPILRHLFGSDLPPIQRGDILWVHAVPAMAEALLPIARRTGARVVFHLHSSAFVDSSRMVLRRIKDHADLIVFCSRFLDQEARGTFADLCRTAVLYNGADESMFFSPERPESRAMTTVLFASRIVPQKGAHVLLSAMRLLAERSVPIRAYVFGASSFGGSQVSDYMRALRADVPPNVQFFGYECGHALAARFREADIFCLPATYADPFPLAVVEAMASGLPVVASNYGGIPEALSGGGGIVVPPSDAPALAEVLEKLVAEPTLMRSLSIQAKQEFDKRFSWSTLRGQYRGLVDMVS